MDTEISSLHGFEFVFEDLGTGALAMAFAAPGIGDAVAEEQDIDVALFGNFDKLFVAGSPALIARGRNSGGIGLGALGRNEADQCGQYGQTKGIANVWFFQRGVTLPDSVRALCAHRQAGRRSRD
ncbi:MAG: hypothetical protein NTZ71_08360 [Planctomycetota bacterium]|nr:hypothetical protein [Planctomycetota bacterium]